MMVTKKLEDASKKWISDKKCIFLSQKGSFWAIGAIKWPAEQRDGNLPENRRYLKLPQDMGKLWSNWVESVWAKKKLLYGCSVKKSTLPDNSWFSDKNWIFRHDFSKNTASVRAFKYQFCPKKSLCNNFSQLDRRSCGVIGISCSIANNNVKLTFWVKVSMDLGHLLTLSDG